uniref:Ras-Related Protein Rabd2A-Like n=1 Tax=Florenciella sp. virus SA2 TaxID=3240092 RepID=A0AB39JEI8_9VIRU
MNKIYNFKTIILGDSGVGKSTLVYKFHNNIYNENVDSTVGISFGSKQLIIDDKIIKIQIWDTAGQERFRSIVRTYYRNVAGCIITYDITNINSFNSCLYWLNEITKENRFVKILLLGTKLDKDDKREVPYKLASKFAEEHNIPFYEITSKNDIEYIFILLIRNMLNGYLYQNHINGVIEIDKEMTVNKKNYCCM